MNKYDFGYELHPDSTVEWAFNKIAPNSEILELGPSNGNLIYHLTQYKNCVADIVEIDTQAGNQAAQYARIACIGPVEGNIEQDVWFNKLSEKRYDYIVILDVLEHIRNPKEVLLHVKQLLKDDGQLLLSIPNIAHNSVLINLLCNKFEYTSVGLLDDTHIHFYTYESAKQLLQQVGLTTVQEEVKQINVSQNEVMANYGMLPQSVEAFLKTRPLGTAYQFLFTIQKGETQGNIQLEYLQDKNYEFVVFHEQNVVCRIPLNPTSRFSQTIELEDSVDELRIDPLNQNCVIKQLEIHGYDASGVQIKLKNYWHTGITWGEKTWFYDNDPQIYLQWETAVSRLSIELEFVCFDNDGLCALEDYAQYVKEIETKYNAIMKLLSENKTKAIINILTNKGF